MAATPRIVDHNWRRAQNPRGVFLLDWLLDEGAAMDAPDYWQPCGAHRSEEFMPGSPAAYFLRTGFTWRSHGDRGKQA
ncbi:MAG: hypothetical protein KJZ76_15675 [Burkholderiaceae bacterium]|nr:hypothetical protein [Burkholderiaceae bacterium]